MVQRYYLLVSAKSSQLCGELVTWATEVLIASRTIYDADSAKVVDSFYEYMFQGNISSGASQLNTSQAARALHHWHAVARLRAGTVSKKGKKTKASFLSWVPFVHLGRSCVMVCSRLIVRSLSAIFSA